MTQHLSLLKRKETTTPRVWKMTHELVIALSKRWGMSITATYHALAEGGSRAETPEAYTAALARLEETDDGNRVFNG
jgi:hypothetical protein